MLNIRRSNERGQADHGWLKTSYSFSFSSYFDPEHMNFGPLRVINEDYIQGGGRFPPHPHKDMEILTYVIKGALEHEDSMGNKGLIRPGELQRMSAGRGVMHSEANFSQDEELHLLQIWILPERGGLEPSYEQASFEEACGEKTLVLLASREGREGSLPLNQDADLYLGSLENGDSVRFTLEKNRGLWLQMIKGSLEVGGEKLEAGDAASCLDPQELVLSTHAGAEFLVFDLSFASFKI